MVSVDLALADIKEVTERTGNMIGISEDLAPLTGILPRHLFSPLSLWSDVVLKKLQSDRANDHYRR